MKYYQWDKRKVLGEQQKERKGSRYMQIKERSREVENKKGTVAKVRMQRNCSCQSSE